MGSPAQLAFNKAGDDKETEKHTLLCLCFFLADFEASHALFPTPEKFPMRAQAAEEVTGRGSAWSAPQSAFYFHQEASFFPWQML